MIDRPDEQIKELIPEAGTWNDGDGIDPEGWVECVGNYELAVGYSLIFWPRFVRFERYVLRYGFSEISLRSWEKDDPPSRAGIEGLMNHVHIADLHVNEWTKNEAQLRYLGRVLKEIHEVKLNRDFPELTFEVFFNDEPGLDPHEYQLTFYQTGAKGSLTSTERS